MAQNYDGDVTGCRVYPVEHARVVFRRCSVYHATVNALPVPPECVVVEGLEPGECRAVELFGEVVIVQRVSKDD